MKIEFPYFERGGQYFPSVDFKLRHDKKKLNVRALVDSGASLSVFQAAVAGDLGINIESGKRVYLTGVGGRILGYFHIVLLELEGRTIKCKIVFSREFNVSLNLLGRDNFFRHFLITFNERAKKVVVASYK